MSDLSHEDDLRLQILLANDVQAVRLDPPRRQLHALTESGEIHLTLHPQGLPDAYWLRVRECLGGHALNSPGGYPVYLSRWTRMGQASARLLPALLCLGEPEAVMAVAHAPALTPELARRAWWALPDSETARAMLAHAAIRADAIGVTLARHLIEFTPFEADARLAMDNVRAALSVEQLGETELASLWQQAQHKPHLQIGFIEHRPAQLAELTGMPPSDAPPGLAPLTAAQRGCLHSALRVLERPAVPEAVTLLRDLLVQQLELVTLRSPPCTPAPYDTQAPHTAAAQALLRLRNLGKRELLAPLGHARPVGALLRRRLAPTLDPLARDLGSLLDPA